MRSRCKRQTFLPWQHSWLSRSRQWPSCLSCQSNSVQDPAFAGDHEEFPGLHSVGLSHQERPRGVGFATPPAVRRLSYFGALPALRKDQPRSVPWERGKTNNPRSCRNPPSGADSPTSRYEVGYHRESASWLRRWFPLRLLPSSRYPSRTGGARREQLQVPRQPGVLALLRRSKPWRSRVYQAELLSHGWCKKVAWAKMAKTLTKLPVGVTLASL